MLLLTACILIGGMVYLTNQGLMRPNHPDENAYPVRGVDVSSYQGEIDWARLKEQGVDFAFIKATEGSGLQDRYFQRNFAGALGVGIRAGAYHFFSFDSPGATQAENFYRAVRKRPGMLPPVVDVEFYGAHASNPPDKEAVQRELHDLLIRLEDWYGMKPILYANTRMYYRYLFGAFDEYPLWIRNIYSAPALLDRAWSFWQYNDRAVLEGYEGTERYIDVNVFNGTEQEFIAFGR